MPIDLNRFISLRPVAYHLTARSNVDRILKLNLLQSTTELLRLARRPDLHEERRRDHVAVRIDSDTVILRDQAPLHAGNIALESGWTFSRFVNHLNSHIFFWPGTEGGPIDYGRRHFKRYKDKGEDCAVLAIPTRDLIAANPAPRFCRYNSGSPRCSGGKPSPRGQSTFTPASDFSGSPSEVVELTFERQTHLPRSALTITDLNHWL